MVSRPAAVGLKLRAVWKYWVRNVVAPNRPTPTAIDATIASAVVRSVMIFSGMIGSATFDSTNTVAASSARPATT